MDRQSAQHILIVKEILPKWHCYAMKDTP